MEERSCYGLRAGESTGLKGYVGLYSNFSAWVRVSSEEPETGPGTGFDPVGDPRHGGEQVCRGSDFLQVVQYLTEGEEIQQRKSSQN